VAYRQGRLPVDLQERMAEEWRQFILETPGHILKVRRALGLKRAAKSVASDLSGRVAQVSGGMR
jgi:hypothetical protein